MPKSAVIFNSIDLHEIFPRLGQLVFLSVGVALLEHPAARLHVRGLRWGARLHRAPRLGADPERARLPCLTMCAFLQLMFLIQDRLDRCFGAGGVAAKSCIKMNLSQLFSGIARILHPFLRQRRIAPALQLVIDVVVRLAMPYQIDIQFFQSWHPL